MSDSRSKGSRGSGFQASGFAAQSFGRTRHEFKDRGSGFTSVAVANSASSSLAPPIARPNDLFSKLVILAVPVPRSESLPWRLGSSACNDRKSGSEGVGRRVPGGDDEAECLSAPHSGSWRLRCSGWCGEGSARRDGPLTCLPRPPKKSWMRKSILLPVAHNLSGIEPTIGKCMLHSWFLVHFSVII